MGLSKVGYLVAVVVMALVATLGTVVVPVQADAAPREATVTLVAPKWWGWCRDIWGIRNGVSVINYQNDTVRGVSGQAWGRDYIKAKVHLHRQNRVKVNVGCRWGHASYSNWETITPTRSGQTFYFGFPDGHYRAP